MGEKWGISQSVYLIPHIINSPFFPIFPHWFPPPTRVYGPITKINLSLTLKLMDLAIRFSLLTLINN